MRFGDTLPPELDHDPFKAILTPRPIGWIGSRSAGGVANLAPYSFFCGVCAKPNMVGFASEGLKHSFANARDRGCFTFSLVSSGLVQHMNVTSSAEDEEVDEFDLAGLTKAECVEIDAPFVAEAPAALECVTISATQLKDRFGTPLDRYFLIGEVVQTHIRDEFIRNRRFDTKAAQPVSRLGYFDYAPVTETWELDRPDPQIL